MEQQTIKVNVYKKFNPQNPKEGIIGQVDAAYVSDGRGGYLKDPYGNLYLAPVGYSPYKSWQNGLKNPSVLLDYRTGGSKDLQRSFNGISFGGFVPAFTPIASFDVGVACSGSPLVLEDICIAGGGAVNLKNRITNPNINIDGQFFNNPKNVPNIKAGYQWGESYSIEKDKNIPKYPQPNIPSIDTILRGISTKAENGQESQIQTTQARSLSINDVPAPAQKLYAQTEEKMRAFYQEFDIPFQEHELKNAAAALAVVAYEKRLPEVQDFELHNGRMAAFYESRGGAYKEALLDADFANNMPQQESFARMIEAEPKLELAAQQRAMEIAAYEQSQSMGRSI